jgi:hypothetical protein
VTSDAVRFVTLVREYLAGKVEWDAVHQFAIEMEWKNVADFRSGASPLNELHMIVLADSKDDPQFRADRSEIEELLTQVERIGLED